MRAYDARDGRIIWEFNTRRPFPTINGVEGKGGGINGPGPVIAGGILYVNSGYGAIGGIPGNVLLAFARVSNSRIDRHPLRPRSVLSYCLTIPRETMR